MPSLIIEMEGSFQYSDFSSLFSQYSCFLFDCDGVLWSGSSEIAGSFKCLQQILAHPNKQAFFLTNNSSRSREHLRTKKFLPFGLEVSEQSIYTSAYATAKYLEKHLVKDKNRDKVYVVGEEGLFAEIRKIGIVVVNEGADEGEDAMSEAEIQALELDPNVVAVVVGIDRKFNFRKLSIAANYIYVQKAKFISTNPDRVLPTQKENRFIPGNGSLVAAIQDATQIEPLLIGKPEPIMFKQILEDHFGEKAPPLEQFLMIGDSLATDIKFGNQCGIDSWLVLTGVTSEVKARQVMLQKHSQSLEGVPTYVSPFFAYQKQQ